MLDGQGVLAYHQRASNFQGQAPITKLRVYSLLVNGHSNELNYLLHSEVSPVQGDQCMHPWPHEQEQDSLHLLQSPARCHSIEKARENRARQEKHSLELLMSIITSCCTTEACPSVVIVTTPFNHWLYLLITIHIRTCAQLHFIQTFPCSSPGVTCDYPVGLSIWHELMNVRHV